MATKRGMHLVSFVGVGVGVVLVLLLFVLVLPVCDGFRVVSLGRTGPLYRRTGANTQTQFAGAKRASTSSAVVGPSCGNMDRNSNKRGSFSRGKKSGDISGTTILRQKFKPHLNRYQLPSADKLTKLFTPLTYNRVESCAKAQIKAVSAVNSAKKSSGTKSGEVDLDVLASMRLLGVQLLKNSTVPFRKDEAWR
jgi:hypothetical protein